MAIARKEDIFEFSAVDKETAAVTRWCDGCFTLHTLDDVWLWPWKYKKIRLNINKIFLPQNTAYCVTEVDTYFKVRNVFGFDCFPTSVKVKGGGWLPMKISKGYPIAKVMFFPLVKPHLYNLDSPQESI